jgi:excinuclease ABC subunit C
MTDELKKIPALPGIYIFRDENDAIIYVGKAVNLRSRVRSYFAASQSNYKTLHMVTHIRRFEYVVTDNATEALVLENNLIKLHHPKFNIRLKDDKAYPYIKITKERVPRIMYSNRRGRDKARYYGPFVSRSTVRELIELIHRLWQLRRCAKVFPRDYMKARPCLNHHIGRCGAPCHKLVDDATYESHLREAEAFIQGKHSGIKERLTREMQAHAAADEFEKAAELRDTLSALTLLTEKQKAETGDADRDIIAMARDGEEALIQIFFVRDGKLSGREHYMMQAAPEEPNTHVISAFVKQFYSEAAFIPKEIILSCVPHEKEQIISWLAQLCERVVAIIVPKKGEKLALLKLAQTNAEITIAQFGAQIKKEAARNAAALQELAAVLDLPAPPARIEAYDISNTQGYESVGSMVVFENGRAKNSDYRKFRLRAVAGPDDYASMKEVISRRMTRYEKADEAFGKLPDIIFVDGGAGQISAAKKATDLPVAGMVKDNRHRTRALLYNGQEVDLPPRGEGFKLVTRIQDEVHRFAYEYHKKLRKDTQLRSILDEVAGIGPARRKSLLQHFGGVEAIRTATVEQLAATPGMNTKSAQALYNFFQEEANRNGD